MDELSVSQLSIYPIKSVGGIVLTQAQVTARGLAWDRRWMIVDDNGQFVTQRSWPILSQVHVALTEVHVVVQASTMPPLLLPLQPETGVSRFVRVWNDTCAALSCGPEAKDWFSHFLNMSCEVVFMPESTHRMVDPKFAHHGEIVSFADGFPFLLISEASLADLNHRLEQPVSMERFRPNIVVRGCAPYAEDTWHTLRIGDVLFTPVKPCARCVMTTVDPQTSQNGPEPLRTLATYRRFNNKVMFGQNLVHQGEGWLRVGDRVEIG